MSSYESNPNDRSVLAEQDTTHINASSLREALPNRLAKQFPKFTVEYGIREDDRAGVFHFYPPKNENWDPNYRMDERLKFAIDKALRPERVSADFAEEQNSFCVIVKDLGLAIDYFSVFDAFFELVCLFDSKSSTGSC